LATPQRAAPSRTRRGLSQPARSSPCAASSLA